MGIKHYVTVRNSFLAYQIGISVVLPMRDTCPYQPVGNTKKEQPHVGRTPIRDVIVMLKIRHRVAIKRIQAFLEVFFMFFPIQNEGFSGAREKESIIRVRMGCRLAQVPTFQN